MEYLKDNIVLFTKDEIDSQLKTIDFNLKQKYKDSNPALKICFSTDTRKNISYIKKLNNLKQNGINFETKYNDKSVKYIIENATPEIITALKAIEINNIREKCTYIYDKLCDELNRIWNEKNPCDFCDNTCIANRNKVIPPTVNGCCYSFKYAKGFFHLLDETGKDPVCKYVEPGKGCSTQNISCKIFACNYIKDKYSFNIDTKQLLLFEAFFNSKQKLILKYNFFRSREELIEKLLEKDTTPYLFYRLKMKFIIEDNLN